MQRRFLTARGFTLTGITCCVGDHRVTCSISGAVLYQRINPAKQSVAHAQIENFMTALDSYFLDTGKFPSNNRAWPHFVPSRRRFEWNGPYLKKDIPSDPWVTRLFIVLPDVMVAMKSSPMVRMAKKAARATMSTSIVGKPNNSQAALPM